MPLSTYPELSSGLVLCIDDNQDVLECEKAFLDYFMPGMSGPEVAIEMRRLRPQAPIIMLSGAVDVPEQVLKWVDAFVAKDRLASQLLSVIAQLHGCGSIPPRSYNA